MTDQILGFMLERGVLGVVVLGLAYWLVRKDREQQTERKEHQVEIRALQALVFGEKDARIGDAKDYNAAAQKITESVFVTVNSSKASDAEIARELQALNRGVGENTQVTGKLLATLEGKPQGDTGGGKGQGQA